MKNHPDLYGAAHDLFYWQYNYDPSRFSCMIYDLISKADETNLAKITKGFPEHVLAFKLWNMSGNFGHDFFDSFGLHSRNLSEK